MADFECLFPSAFGQLQVPNELGGVGRFATEVNPFFEKSIDFFSTGFVEIRATTKERLGITQAKPIHHLSS